MQEEPLEFTERHYFTPTPIEKSGPFWPVRLGRNIAKPNYHAGPKVTTYFSLHFVLKGEGAFLQSNKVYPLSQGDTFCLFPNVAHEYYTAKEHPLHMVWIAFDGKKAAQVLERTGLTSASPYRTNAMNSEVPGLLDTFFDIANSPVRGDRDLARLGVLYQIIDALTVEGYSSGNKDGDRTGSWLQKGLEYLEMHYAEGITIGKVASFVGVDRGYFSKRFLEAYGASPIKYLQQLKLNKAMHMLEGTEYKLTEIALSVGYPDLFSFSKSFKKHFGVSPNTYRNKIVRK